MRIQRTKRLSGGALRANKVRSPNFRLPPFPACSIHHERPCPFLHCCTASPNGQRCERHDQIKKKIAPNPRVPSPSRITILSAVEKIKTQPAKATMLGTG